MTDKLLITIISGIVIWGIKEIVVHLIRGARLKAGLVADIKTHIAGSNEQKDAVKILVNETAKEGKELPFPISYNVGQYGFYNSIQKELPVYLSKSELIKVIKFYQALWELDVSVKGLATTLGFWERDKRKLSQNDLQHIKKRSARIESYCNLIGANEISSISNLPDDYRQVKPAYTVVEQT